MPKNIVIAEGTTGKTFTGVEKLKTQLQGGGTCNWVPEDEAGEYVSLKTKNITKNGEYFASADECTGYSKVKVNVKTNTKAKRIDTNGTYNAGDEGLDGYSSVVVNVEGGGGSKIGSRKIRMNGIYKAAADNLDGYGTVVVSVGGVTPNYGRMTEYGASIVLGLRAGDMTGGIS